MSELKEKLAALEAQIALDNTTYENKKAELQAMKDSYNAQIDAVAELFNDKIDQAKADKDAAATEKETVEATLRLNLLNLQDEKVNQESLLNVAKTDVQTT